MPWYIEELEDKVQTALGMNNLTCLDIDNLNCKSWVANEFLDNLTCYDLPEHGLEKLILNYFYHVCEPFQDEVVARIANMCPRITHLQLSWMCYMSETGRLSMLSLFRQIIQHSPQLDVLNM